MRTFALSERLFLLLTGLIGSVWIFRGLYSKILNGIPRHEMIVARVLGEGFATPATKIIGILEVLMGVWVFSRWKRKICASVQTLALVGMNVLEIALATDLLISAPGMAILNLAFLSIVWMWAARSLAELLGKPTHLQHGADAE